MKSATPTRKGQPAGAERTAEECTCGKCGQTFDFALLLNGDGERLCDTCHERANMGVHP